MHAWLCQALRGCRETRPAVFPLGIYSHEGTKICASWFQSKEPDLSPSTLYKRPRTAQQPELCLLLEDLLALLPQYFAMPGVPFTYRPSSNLIILQGPFRCHLFQEALSDSPLSSAMASELSLHSPPLPRYLALKTGHFSSSLLVLCPQLGCELLKGRAGSDASLYPHVTYPSSWHREGALWTPGEVNEWTHPYVSFMVPHISSNGHSAYTRMDSVLNDHSKKWHTGRSVGEFP